MTQETRTRVEEIADEQDGELVEDDLVIEEVSIDGMCGVY